MSRMAAVVRRFSSFSAPAWRAAAATAETAAAAPTPADAAAAASARAAKREEYERRAAVVAARIDCAFTDPAVFVQAVTHRSYRHAQLPCNDRLALFGSTLMRTRVTESLYVSYPRLPTEALAAAVEEYAGLPSLAHWARAVGLHEVARWTPAVPRDETSEETAEASNALKAGEDKVLGTCVQALVAANYHDRGMDGALTFVDKHILSRHVDLQKTLTMSNPKGLLTALMVRQGRPKPESRILAETGRKSHNPMFRIGVFSGSEMLAEASAQSIKLATTLAAKRALQEYFLEELDRSPYVDGKGNLRNLQLEDTRPH